MTTGAFQVLLFDKSLEGFMMPVFVFYVRVSRDLYFLSFRMPDKEAL